MRPEEVEHLAERIKRGENGELLRALHTACRPYLNTVREGKGFRSLGEPAVMERLVEESLPIALAAWRKEKCSFIMKLRSAFLHECRAEMRRKAEDNVCVLEGRLSAEGNCLDNTVDSRHGSPEIRAQRSERQRLLSEALEREHKQSRAVVMERLRGSSHETISKVMGITVLRSRHLHNEDVERVTQYLKSRCPGCFAE